MVLQNRRFCAVKAFFLYQLFHCEYAILSTSHPSVALVLLYLRLHYLFESFLGYFHNYTKHSDFSVIIYSYEVNAKSCRPNYIAGSAIYKRTNVTVTPANMH